MRRISCFSINFLLYLVCDTCVLVLFVLNKISYVFIQTISSFYLEDETSEFRLYLNLGRYFKILNCIFPYFKIGL
jgi:hypothetical protein